MLGNCVEGVMTNKTAHKYSTVSTTYMLTKTAGSLHLGACVMVDKLRKCLF